ncbi:MAG: IS66 family insertion sequence element accessory protein TnpB [Leptospiraceae bacterium]|nr:IS66 family insertion sequence element accessory protein TnpB [Leptospiraceae bacterium]
MNLDPYSRSLFLFSGHSRKLSKIFYWDGNGFCIWQKKLQSNFGGIEESEESQRTESSGCRYRVLLKIADLQYLRGS